MFVLVFLKFSFDVVFDITEIDLIAVESVVPIREVTSPPTPLLSKERGGVLIAV